MIHVTSCKWHASCLEGGGGGGGEVKGGLGGREWSAERMGGGESGRRRDGAEGGRGDHPNVSEEEWGKWYMMEGKMRGE
jgi:hypothetical protein